LSAIKESISFNYNVIDIYHQPLFCNSEILISGKTILWNDFITAGITQLKDICYEVKTATFLYTLLEYNTNIYSLMTYIQFLLAISYSIYLE
jgi:hypothetical protein